MQLSELGELGELRQSGMNKVAQVSKRKVDSNYVSLD